MNRGADAKSELDAGRPDSRDAGRAFASEGFGAEFETTLAVIAGGAGVRMGGPKHTLRIDGTPILRFVLDRLGWRGPTMLVVQDAGVRVEGQEKVSQVVADSVADEGPLRGVLTALERCETEMLIAVPIDMPGLCAAHLLWVLERGNETECERVLLRRSVNGRAEMEPFPAFFRVAGTGPMRQLLADGRRALRDLAEVPRTSVVDAPVSWPEATWMNLNTPADADRFGAQLGAAPHEGRAGGRP